MVSSLAPLAVAAVPSVVLEADETLAVEEVGIDLVVVPAEMRVEGRVAPGIGAYCVEVEIVVEVVVDTD